MSLKNNEAFGSFSVDDLEKAEAFYRDTLGVEVKNPGGVGIRLELNGSSFFVYKKNDHQPATYTVLNFKVNDLNAVVADLREKGIDIDAPDGGPHRIAWFKDPAGNYLSLMQV